MRSAILFLLVLCLSGLPAAGEASGSGSLRAGYLILDTEGNRSVDYGTFNYYEGFNLSMERFNYTFKNGNRIKADLRNIGLENRSAQLGFTRSRLFGFDINERHYRRIYDAEGFDSTEREQVGGTFWFAPAAFIRFYGGAANTEREGTAVALSDLSLLANADEDPTIRHDYNQADLHGGVRLNHKGRMLQVDLRTIDYADDIDPTRDQSRRRLRANLYTPIPRYEFLAVFGGLSRYESRFDHSKAEIFSNTGWGGANIAFPKGFSLRADVRFNRAGDDNDTINTDNISNAFYAGYAGSKTAGGTIGYQHDLNDDFEDEVEANSFYFSGWVLPFERVRLQGEFGNRSEEVNEGQRLLGDEDLNRWRITGRLRCCDSGMLSLKYESRRRENERLDHIIDFKRFSANLSATCPKLGVMSAGYTYSIGDYDNIDDALAFEFTEQTLQGNLETKEYRNLVLGFGAIYYRSRRDLDAESFNLNFSGDVRIAGVYHFITKYNVHNFDDFLASDRYDTANLWEISLSRDLSF